MFAEKEHDFGTVARGADTVYKFPVKNIYKQDIELVSVRSSCGCTSPTLENKTLKTGDVGYVVATLQHAHVRRRPQRDADRRASSGTTTASLAAAKPSCASTATSAATWCSSPVPIKFEGVDQGTKSEQQVRVTYAGRSDWKITDVRGASDDLEVELTETQRFAGRVSYDLLVRMKDSAAGRILQRATGAGDQRQQQPADSAARRRSRRSADFRVAGIAACSATWPAATRCR